MRVQDHYHGVRRVGVLLDELNQFEGNVHLDADPDDTMAIRFGLLDAARDHVCQFRHSRPLKYRIVASRAIHTRRPLGLIRCPTRSRGRVWMSRAASLKIDQAPLERPNLALRSPACEGGEGDDGLEVVRQVLPHRLELTTLEASGADVRGEVRRP
jgi:hypothetical protein